MTTEPPPLPPAVRQSKVPVWLQLLGVGFVALALIAMVIVAGGAITSLTSSNTALTKANGQLVDQNGQLSKNSDALHSQVEALGHTPVAPPASAVTEHPSQPGKDGTNGRDGVSIDRVTCQADGTWLVAYDNETTEQFDGPCIGQDGQTVIGPKGDPGKDGKDGADGRDGVDGAPGAPPSSWTIVWLGVTYLCAPTDPFDKNAPTYTCSPATP